MDSRRSAVKPLSSTMNPGLFDFSEKLVFFLEYSTNSLITVPQTRNFLLIVVIFFFFVPPLFSRFPGILSLQKAV